MKRLLVVAAAVAAATAGLAPAAHAVGITVCAGGVTANVAYQHVEQDFGCHRVEVPPPA